MPKKKSAANKASAAASSSDAATACADDGERYALSDPAATAALGALRFVLVRPCAHGPDCEAAACARASQSAPLSWEELQALALRHAHVAAGTRLGLAP